MGPGWQRDWRGQDCSEQEGAGQEGMEQEGAEQEDTYIYTVKMCKLSKSLSHMHTNTHCSLKQCFHSCFLPHVHNPSLPIGRVGGGSHLVCSKLLPTTCKASNHCTHPSTPILHRDDPPKADLRCMKEKRPRA